MRGWRPVDARIAITDAPHLVEVLGGEQLYGKEPEVALRELLQNAQDAVMARNALDPGFGDEEIRVSLTEDNGTWVLTVTDRGVGMDEDILTNALLDFGRSGWTSDVVRNKFVGLADGGFRPKGRFGIGFFSVFILGDDIEITTRRFDAAPGEARKLRFRGVRQRPILTPVPAEVRTPIGTTIRTALRKSPYDSDGLFKRTHDDELGELIQRVCVQRSITILASEPQRGTLQRFPPTDLATATPEEVFDLLQPPSKSDGPIGELQRGLLRTEFARRATAVIDSCGNRVGLTALGDDLNLSSPRAMQGAVIVDGFRADEHLSFTGYVLGRPSRASRDQVELAVDQPALRTWLVSQEDRIRDLDLFTPSVQALLAYLLYRAHGSLRDDHYVAYLSTGLATVVDVSRWVEDQSVIMLSQGWPLGVTPRPMALVRFPQYSPAVLPDGWLHPIPSYLHEPFLESFDPNRDPNFESARADPTNTWQKIWWRTSGLVEGLVLTLICRAWQCDVADILAPVAERGWNDFAEIGDGAGPVPVYRLVRPTPRT